LNNGLGFAGGTDCGLVTAIEGGQTVIDSDTGPGQTVISGVIAGGQTSKFNVGWFGQDITYDSITN